MENRKITLDNENEIKKAEIELEKSNMDENMLRYEAIKLAKRCYAGKYIERTNITNMGSNDPSSAVMAGFLAKLDLTKEAISNQ